MREHELLRNGKEDSFEGIFLLTIFEAFVKVEGSWFSFDHYQPIFVRQHEAFYHATRRRSRSSHCRMR